MTDDAAPTEQNTQSLEETLRELQARVEELENPTTTKTTTKVEDMLAHKAHGLFEGLKVVRAITLVIFIMGHLLLTFVDFGFALSEQERQRWERVVKVIVPVELVLLGLVMLFATTSDPTWSDRKTLLLLIATMLLSTCLRLLIGDIFTRLYITKIFGSPFPWIIIVLQAACEYVVSKRIAAVLAEREAEAAGHELPEFVDNSQEPLLEKPV